MTLLTRLGLLGLISIIILIIIYIIKPNYQQKMVSSTYVWKLSLRYRKKKIPTSKLRNILLFLCQVLILTAMSLILAQPVIDLATAAPQTDVVYIVDSSASMYAGLDGETRFDRAVDGVEESADAVLDAGGLVSVIVADDEPAFLLERVSAANRTSFDEAMATLRADTACFYGTSDIEGAISLSQRIVDSNAEAQVYLYTDTEYGYTENINVVSVAEEDEWNVAILDASAELNDGYYTITVDVACYGANMNVRLDMNVSGANAEDNNDNQGENIQFSQSVECTNDETQRIVFRYGEGAEQPGVVYQTISEQQKFYSYQSIFLSISQVDSFLVDNTFNLYGGQKEVVKIQYASSLPNKFVNTALETLQSNFSDRWDIQITEVRQGSEPALVGYDLYIFEHEMPEILPADGVVFLLDPSTAPVGSDIGIQGEQNLQGLPVPLSVTDASSALLDYIPADWIQDMTISRFFQITYDATYQPVLSCGSYPALLVRKEGTRQTMVMSFSVHYANSGIKAAFPSLFANAFNYFFPSMVSREAEDGELGAVGNVFDVNESIVLKNRGAEIFLKSSSNADLPSDPYKTFPTSVILTLPGTYTVSQTTYFGKEVTEEVYVRTPAIESNIKLYEERLDGPTRAVQTEDGFKDLLVYLAAALVALLFIEWILKSKDNA